MSRVIFGLTLALSLCLGAEGVLAAAAKLKGVLSEPGYQIIASDADGNSVVSKQQKFKLKLRARTGTLALVDSNGNAAGPVVLAIRTGQGKILSFTRAVSQGVCAESGTRAITGFRKKKIKLGSVQIDTANGFAYATRRLKKKHLFLDAQAPVDAECVPEGAGGKLGLTRTGEQSLRPHAAGAEQGDTDGDGTGDQDDPDDDNDGVADLFDLDQNGDGILDFYQEDDSGRLTDGDGEGDSEGNEDNNDDEDDYRSFVFSDLQVSMVRSINLHVVNATREEIDDFVSQNLVITMAPSGDGDFPVELDCTGLSYCTSGGTGRVADRTGGHGAERAFPDDFDDDGDGLGRIDEVASENSIGDFFLKPNATTAEIKPGNVMTQVFTPTKKKKEIRRPLQVEFVFITTPALKSIRLGEENPETSQIAYPVSPGDPGTVENCFHYSSSLGHKITLTAHRPQRPGIETAGEAEFMDMGNLRIVVSASSEDGQPPVFCPVSSFSTSDPNLQVYTGSADGEEPDEEVGLLDTRGDVAFDPEGDANTFTFSLDLQDCLGTQTGKAYLNLKVRTPRNDNAAQRFCVERI